MEILVIVLLIYVACGFGFSLATYLQYAEVEISLNNDIPDFISPLIFISLLAWPYFAYKHFKCYIKQKR